MVQGDRRMAVSGIDAVAALVVIDLQVRILSFPTVRPVPEIVVVAQGLARAFRRHGLPVVLVNVNGQAPGRSERSFRRALAPGFSDLLPELEVQPSDHRVTKQTWGAFTGTDLDAHLRGLGVTQVVLCGVATSAGVESTARQAHELGFNVVLAVDAMTDGEAAVHANSVEKIFPRLGETGTSGEIIALIEASRGDRG